MSKKERMVTDALEGLVEYFPGWLTTPTLQKMIITWVVKNYQGPTRCQQDYNDLKWFMEDKLTLIKQEAGCWEKV